MDNIDTRCTTLPEYIETEIQQLYDSTNKEIPKGTISRIYMLGYVMGRCAG